MVFCVRSFCAAYSLQDIFHADLSVYANPNVMALTASVRLTTLLREANPKVVPFSVTRQ